MSNKNNNNNRIIPICLIESNRGYMIYTDMSLFDGLPIRKWVGKVAYFYFVIVIQL